MASVCVGSISHAVPGRRRSTQFTEIGRDEGVNRGMSFRKPPPFDSTRPKGQPYGCPLGRVNPNSHRNRPVQSESRLQPRPERSGPRGIGIHHAGAELEPAKGDSGVKR